MEDRDWESANQQIRQVVDEVTTASELKELYYECRSLKNYAGDAALFHIHYRLAALNTDDGTQALVDLFADGNLEWHCPLYISLFNAITRCGKRAQPYLAKLTTSEQAGCPPEHLEVIPELIGRIEKGEFYDPGIDILVADHYGVRIDVADAQRRLEEQELTIEDGF